MLGGCPFVSVIVPVHNGSRFLDRCLGALAASHYSPYEIIVVNDASTDDSAPIAGCYAATVLNIPVQSGAAAARNHGASRARGDILLFVDADVAVQPGTAARVVSDLTENPDVVAVFGSYDDHPAEPNFVSQYKNLLHHFIHQRSRREAETFWSGCGAVRRDAFQAVGGFDANRYAIEDIELGYRIRRLGGRIILDKELQVTHLKRWTFGSLLRADIFQRAIPWSLLMLEHRELLNDLNVRTSDRLSAVAGGLSVALLPFLLVQPRLAYLLSGLWALIILLNRDLYAFFVSKGGIGFALAAFPLHLLYYVYSGMSFVACWLLRGFVTRRSGAATVAR